MSLLGRPQGQGSPFSLGSPRGGSQLSVDPRSPLQGRSPAAGRNCSDSLGQPGKHGAGRLLSILATAHLAGLNVNRYLLDWLDACARNEGQAPADLSAWLPWEMDEERMQELRAPPERWWTPANGPPAARAHAPGRPVPRAA